MLTICPTQYPGISAQYPGNQVEHFYILFMLYTIAKQLYKLEPLSCFSSPSVEAINTYPLSLHQQLEIRLLCSELSLSLHLAQAVYGRKRILHLLPHYYSHQKEQSHCHLPEQLQPKLRLKLAHSRLFADWVLKFDVTATIVTVNVFLPNF